MELVFVCFYIGWSINICFWKAGSWLTACGCFGLASAFWWCVKCNFGHEHMWSIWSLLVGQDAVRTPLPAGAVRFTAKPRWYSTRAEKLAGSVSKAKEINEKENTESINDLTWKSRAVPETERCSEPGLALAAPKAPSPAWGAEWAGARAVLSAFCRGKQEKDASPPRDEVWGEFCWPTVYLFY